MRILAFGTYQAANHPRVTVLVEGLRATGHSVAEANVPLGLSTRDRVAMLGSRGGAVRLAGRLLRSWSRLTLRSVRYRGRNRPDAVLVGYMGHFDVWLARLLFPRTTIVLDHLVSAATTAADRGVGDRGVRLRMLRALDAAAIRIADVVLVDTAEHADLVPDAQRPKVLVVPVGATAPWFAAARTDASGTEPLRVVFVGLFTPLQGATTIGAAIGMLPAAAPIRVTMIGSGQDLAAARRAAVGGAMVDWVPWVDADALPAVVAGHDVGLGIFGTTPKAAKVVPNKVYQCAAAGTAVVTSDTAPQRRAFGDGAVFVPAGDPGALAARLLDLAEDRDALRTARAAARRAADAFRPEAVVAELDARLRER